MDYDSALIELQRFNIDELIYRDHHKNPGIPNADFIAKYPNNPAEVKFVLQPETIHDYLEDEYIARTRNVTVVKHPRYFPLFYHEHEFFEVIYILSGSCTQRFQDKSLCLSKGDMCMIAPNIIHGIEVFDESVILNLLIKRSTFFDIFQNTVRDKTQLSFFFLDNLYSKKKTKYLIYHTHEDKVIRNYILDMYIEQVNVDEFSDRIICSMLMIFFTQLSRRHSKTMEVPDANRLNRKFENEIVSYMTNNYSTITLSELARYLNFSVPYCSHLIKEVSGYTFSQLLTNIKVQHGENLLLSTQLSIAEISEKLGYENPETFSRVIKRHYNMTPNQYRKKMSG